MPQVINDPGPAGSQVGQRFTAGLARDDKFAAAATEALLRRTGVRFSTAESEGAAHLRHKSLLEICQISLAHDASIRLTDEPEEIARRALRGNEGPGIAASGGSYSHPGDFPNILSSMIGKILDEPVDYAPVTYRTWAREKPAVADFKTHPLVRLGEFGEFPRVPDDAEFEDSTAREELSHVTIDRFGDEFRVTPRMIIDDDLGAFEQAVRDKQIAHEMTLNRLCVEVLTSNPTLIDGTALFHADHGNLIDTGSGAPPDATELADMRLLLRNQTGTSAKRKLGLPLSLILVPNELETTTEQLLAPLAQLAIVAQPTSDASINVFRGRTNFAVEPMLSDYSAAVWYGFADPRIVGSIVFCFQKGYEKLRVTSYVQNNTGSRVYQCEGRFAAAASNFRGVAKNAGA